MVRLGSPTWLDWDLHRGKTGISTVLRLGSPASSFVHSIAELINLMCSVFIDQINIIGLSFTVEVMFHEGVLSTQTHFFNIIFKNGSVPVCPNSFQHSLNSFNGLF